MATKTKKVQPTKKKVTVTPAKGKVSVTYPGKRVRKTPRLQSTLLTAKQYAERPKKSGQVRCPVCQEAWFSDGYIDVEGNHAYQDTECDRCGSTWTDVYTLSGYTGLVLGKTSHGEKKKPTKVEPQVLVEELEDNEFEIEVEFEFDEAVDHHSNDYEVEVNPVIEDVFSNE